MSAERNEIPSFFEELERLEAEVRNHRERARSTDYSWLQFALITSPLQVSIVPAPREPPSINFEPFPFEFWDIAAAFLGLPDNKPKAKVNWKKEGF